MIVFDLDGTIALDHHRSHLLMQEPKQWEEYFRLCSGDELNQPVYEIMKALDMAGHSLAIWSGRSGIVRDDTMKWLQLHGILDLVSQVRLRPAADRTQDTTLKRTWLYEQQATSDPVTLVFEDRARVVAMWRAEGIPCFQVAPGEF